MAKIKGSAILPLIKFMRSHPSDVRSLLPAELHTYLEQEILTASWYPEEDLLALIRAGVQLLPGTTAQNLALMGQMLAREHAEGVYAHLVEDIHSNPASIHGRATALWSSQHDSGRLVMMLHEPGEATFELRDYALPSKELCAIVSSYMMEALRIGGLAKTWVEKLKCLANGDDACLWRATWSSVSTAKPDDPESD